MRKLYIYCCSHFHNKKIELLKNIIPAGTGKNRYPENWFTDNVQNNISNLNKTYAELTFHYWIWKNYLDNFSKNDLVGFCQYRRFWLKKNHDEIITFDNLDKNLLSQENFDQNNCDVFLTKSEKIYIKKKSILKYRSIFENIKNPKPIFNRSAHSVGLQFQISTKTKNIIYDVAKYLHKVDQDDYLDFLNNTKQVNFHNMFITNKIILNEYMTYLFKWLELCNEEIKKNNFDTDSSRRIHAFLAERFMHFWFNKFHKISEIPYAFVDTSK